MESVDELGTKDREVVRGMADRWYELIAIHPAGEYPIIEIGGTHYTYDVPEGDVIRVDESLLGEASLRINGGKLVGPFLYRTREAAERAQRKRLAPYGTLRHVEVRALVIRTPEPLRQTVVYVDGSCLGVREAGSVHTGPGGWAWAVETSPENSNRYRSGYAASTTNQRMELQAPLEAVRAIQGPLKIVSDSAYVVNCFLQGWWRKWRTNGWRTANGAVANKDLWEQLLRICIDERPGEVTWEKVKGHSGVRMNEIVDKLANGAARSGKGVSMG